MTGGGKVFENAKICMTLNVNGPIYCINFLLFPPIVPVHGCSILHSNWPLVHLCCLSRRPRLHSNGMRAIMKYRIRLHVWVEVNDDIQK